MEYDDIVDRRRRYSALLEKSLESLIETLRRRPDILRISIFGSYARGRTDLFTDLDVLVIMDSARPFIERLETGLNRKRQEMGHTGLVLLPDTIPQRFARQYSRQSLY